MQDLKVNFEPTPNPATLKFILPQDIVAEGFECRNIEEAECSPLATKIFGFPWTASIYIGKNFLTVTKQDWVDWQFLAQPLSKLIQDHLIHNEPVLIEIQKEAQEDSDTNPLVRDIKSILNREIRPMVAMDGGDVLFDRIENNILYVKMKGACSGCPSSRITLKQGIELRIRQLFPEILEVQSV